MCLPALPVAFIVMLGNRCLEITPVLRAMGLKPTSETKLGMLSAVIPTEGTLSHPKPRELA